MNAPPETTNSTEPAALPKRNRPLRRILAFVAVFYVGWCTTLYFYQDKLQFPADSAPAPMPAGSRLPNSIVLRRPIDGGDAVAWFLPAQRASASQPAPVVVYFHGNAEIIDYQDNIVVGYHRLGCSVLLPEYRGYGRSAGRPSESGIVSDAVWFYDELVKRHDVDNSRIVFHGRSLGGGPAARLATQRKPAALILESTFTSAAAMAHKYYAPEFLVKNPFHVDDALTTFNGPLLIMHGTNDDIIPIRHGRRLHEIAPAATYLEFNCAHNDFPGACNQDQYWRAIEDLLRRSAILPEARR